ncbi:sensor domain-containing diguanylate cyclase (plasmid) [Rhizobium sp. TH2]|uniref:sensor domain-containing diguanylate cyclase n=1 Tax=Rhizobium sp. TH2 TaxID=2775403 RepID=UPI002158818D|nr:sensor domain-containing diguanylate cyclase [Rhizobium sp. TH2]UVC12444.1 sensor domain-containing diguanylate cyclase [Rhizobium sp. TH2]
MNTVRTFGRSTAERAQRERERLEALDQFDLLDAPRDASFDRIVRLIKEVFSVDIGIVSVIDAHRQWYQACVGLPNAEVPREETFCQLIVESEEPLIVQDATKDARFANNPMVTGEAHIRFYAGVPLKTREGFILGTVCAIDRRPKSFGARDLTILQELAGLAMDRIELLQSAATDGLTGVLTRRAFKSEAEKLIAQALRHQHDLSCLVLDVDHFKRVNDSFGHAAGDDVLKAESAACKATLRAGDLIGRLGGEEFAILLPHVDRAAAAAVAEKLRIAIADVVVSGDFGSVSVTASIGTTNLSIVSRDIDTLVAQADAAMYSAKNGGRNCCMSWHNLQGASGGERRRVLKSGSILFNDRRSTIDCTVKSLGSDGAGLVLSNTSAVPAEFDLVIRGEGFETRCRVIAQDRQNVEVAFA